MSPPRCNRSSSQRCIAQSGHGRRASQSCIRRGQHLRRWSPCVSNRWRSGRHSLSTGSRRAFQVRDGGAKLGENFIDMFSTLSKSMSLTSSWCGAGAWYVGLGGCG